MQRGEIPLHNSPNIEFKFAKPVPFTLVVIVKKKKKKEAHSQVSLATSIKYCKLKASEAANKTCPLVLPLLSWVTLNKLAASSCWPVLRQRDRVILFYFEVRNAENSCYAQRVVGIQGIEVFCITITTNTIIIINILITIIIITIIITTITIISP